VNEQRWRTIQELFLAARDLPLDARDDYLRAACPDDAELRADVRRMLAADSREGILDRTAPVLALSDLAVDDPAQERVGPYLLTGEIGRGGMGVVYRAYDQRLRRDVALKFLPSAWSQDVQAKARFIDEARAASALDHPHTCPVYDIGSTDDGRVYIAMAYCAGGSLAARLASGPMPIDQAVRVAAQVAGALDRAHQAAIVHRDIKPANIAFTEHGEARVLDFGVAVLGTGEWAVPTVAAGTPAYMAPEQVRGDAVDRRTDVWALGAVLFEMLTGRRAFSGNRTDATHAILHDAPDDVRSLRPEVPAPLGAAVARALAKDPADRFATAADFGAAITAALSAGTAPEPRATTSARRRVVRGAALLGIAALVMTAGTYVASRRVRLTGESAGLDANAVAILPFRVRGESSIEYLREGMVDLLAAKLTGEGGLRAADPRGVYAAWRRVVRDEREDLPLDSASVLAQRLGAGNVLLGDVVGTAASLVVNASIVNARGSVLGRATAQGAHTDLSALVDRLVAQLLTVSSGEEPQRLGVLTSTSLPALRAYLEGQAAYRRGRYAEALEKFGRALDLDSTFALAGLGLSLADGWVGTGHARQRGRAAAWRWRERLSPRDRALLAAHVGAAYPRPPTALEQLAATEEALRLAPDRVELWYSLGDLYFHFGRILGTDGWEAEAEKALRRSVDADSAFAPSIHHLVALYARQARRDELRRLVAATRAVELEGATADYIRWRVGTALGTAPLDTVALDSMATEAIGWIGMNSQDDGVAVPVGERALRLRSARPSTREERFERHLSLHAVALNAGRPREAAALSESIRDVQPDSSFHLRLRILSALYGDGDRLTAERAAASLGIRPARDGASRLNRCILEQWRLAGDATSASSPSVAVAENTGTSGASAAEQLCEATIEAIRTSHRADSSVRRQAFRRLDDLLRSGLAEFYPGDGHLEYGPIALARILEASGDRAGALAAVRRRPYFIGWQPFLAASLRAEVRLALEVGDLRGAIRASEHYLALRHDPEPPMRASADSVRAELARARAPR
jgi:tetratricopeptide (TPR) repeat protein